MSDLSFYVGLSGLDAQQTVLDAISNDIANSTTPGYQRQQVQLQPLAADPPGSGVSVASIQNVSDAAITAQMLAASSAASEANSLSQVLQAAQGLFPEPSSSGISSQLQALWSAFNTAASNPTNTAARAQVVDAAASLASSLNDAATQISQLAAETTAQIQDTVNQDNSLLQQVASLNSQITADQSEPGASPTALEDQRNELTQQLASDLGITVRDQSNGSVSVYLDGFELVQGGRADQLGFQTSSNQVTIADPSNPTSPLGSVSPQGSLGGLVAGLSYLASVAPNSITSQLNAFASSLAQVVNTQLEAGAYYTSGSGGTLVAQAGIPLFVASDGSASITASNIAVNPALQANPGELALSAPPGSPTSGPGDGSNAQALAALGNAPTNSSGYYVGSPGVGYQLPASTYQSMLSPSALYQGFVSNLGTAVSNAQTAAKAAQAASQTAQSAWQSVSGVDQNEEMVAMLQAQQAYEAAAKVISTVNATIQYLLSTV
jgi:flagellar hook-associated protein 1 FlgK